MFSLEHPSFDDKYTYSIDSVKNCLNINLGNTTFSLIINDVELERIINQIEKCMLNTPSGEIIALSRCAISVQSYYQSYLFIITTPAMNFDFKIHADSAYEMTKYLRRCMMKRILA